MKKDRKTFQKSRHLLIILTIVCVCAIVLTATDIVSVEPVRKAAGIVVVPFQNGIGRIGSWFSGDPQDGMTHEELAEENAHLRERVAALEEENTILHENTNELEELRALYDLDHDYSEYDKVMAKVVANNGGNWFDSFTINKGSDDGIQKDMNVLSEGGLAGIVTDVGKNWAKVRSIIDDTSSVSGMLLSTSETCIVSGSLELQKSQKLALSQLNTERVVSAGERIVTSSISDKYLEGILIGYVDTITDDSNHLTQTGTVIPAVDFHDIKNVFVIKQLKAEEDASQPGEGF